MTAKQVLPHDAWEDINAGKVVLIDLRPPLIFCQAHPRGAINVLFSKRGLVDRILTVVPRSARFLLLAGTETEGKEASAQVEGAGLALIGVVAGGYDAWRNEGLPVAALAESHLPDLATETAGLVIDVREPFEWEMGCIDGASLIPLGDLRDRVSELPRDRRITIICEAGLRSATAGSLLLAAGFTDVSHVPEGMRGVRAAGLPLSFPETSKI